MAARQTQLSQLLKQCRNSVALTQKELALALGYSTSQFISNWERGLSVPPMDKLEKLSELFKVHPDALFSAILREAMVNTQNDLLRRRAL